MLQRFSVFLITLYFAIILPKLFVLIGISGFTGEINFGLHFAEVELQTTSGKSECVLIW